MSSKKTESLFILAQSYEATGQIENALATYNELIPKAPNVPEYINNRGVIYFNKLRRYEEAKADFEQCLRMDPGNGLYHLNLSRCYYMLNDFENAKVNAQIAKDKGVSIDPAYAQALGL